MRTQSTFIFTLCCALLLTWLTSGQRLVDTVFLMPDLGPVDDLVISAVLAAEDWKEGLGLEDYFGAVRSWLHSVLGISD